MSEDSPQKNGENPLEMEINENTNITEYLEVLEDHRKTCEREGRYVEAEMCKARIEELRMGEGHRQMENLMLKQQHDRLEIEETHNKEYQGFTMDWDEKMGAKEENHSKLIGEMEARHMQELEENRQILEEKLPQQPKPSSELLNMKKIQDQYARQKEYGEAHKIQTKVTKMDSEEMEKHLKWREKKFVSCEADLIKKQQNQLNALKKKLEAIENEDRRCRELDQNKMLQRYQNVNKELES